MNLDQITCSHPSPSTDPYLHLAVAILSQATKEAKSGDASAAEYLLSPTADLMLTFLGINSESVQRQASEWLRNAGGRIVIRIVIASEEREV